jgi:hypothetical protein
VNLFLETFSFNCNVLFCLEKAYRKMSSAFTTFLRGKASNMPTVPRWNLHRGYRWFRESTPISSVVIRRWVGVMCGICGVMASDYLWWIYNGRVLTDTSVSSHCFLPFACGSKGQLCVRHLYWIEYPSIQPTVTHFENFSWMSSIFRISITRCPYNISIRRIP